jgi:hypothetical protein
MVRRASTPPGLLVLVPHAHTYKGAIPIDKTDD